MIDSRSLLGACHFPSAGTAVDLAVSGGPDSVGLLVLARAADLVVTVHHVDHHLRPTSGDDARAVTQLCADLGVDVVVHDVVVEPGGNLEARARAARRRVLPAGVLTGHTRDDLAETLLLNLIRGAGLDGLSPMIGDPTKPLRDVRRRDLHDLVAASGLRVLHDETNDSAEFRRNRVRAEVIPLLDDVAERDVVEVLARQAQLIGDERAWLVATHAEDLALTLDGADCRELRTWEVARLRRWLRARLRHPDGGDGEHPPSADEVERAMSVVRGDAVATQIAGGRRLSRSAQHLTLEEPTPLR